MKRREFLKKNTGLLASVPLLNLQPLNFEFMETEIFKCKIGEFECTIFKDLMFKYQAKDYFINADQNELKNILNTYNVDPLNIPSPYISMLLQNGNQKILIDSGIGFSEEPIVFKGKTFVLKGKLKQLLDNENIDTNKITDVIVTHFHPDHIGGICTSKGELVFKNAKFHIHRKEWDFWHSSKSANQPPLFKFFIEKNISQLRDKNLNFITQDYQEICDGIIAVNAHGHTQGQIALIIGNGNNKLLYISDAFLHPIHIERLDWQTNYDFDHKKAKETRIKLLELAYKENMKINAFHFDFPGLGFVERNGDKWKWIYNT